MDFSANKVELIPKVAFITNVGKFRSSEHWLQSISPRAGIYAWFRTYSYENLNKEAFKSQLFSDINSRKYADRSGRVGPLHRVTLTSDPKLEKVDRIEAALESPEFRDSLAKALSFSILLQAPLYIGKALNLQNRLAKHIKGQSELKNRLAEAGIVIETCSLLYIYTHPEVDEYSVSEVPNAENQIDLIDDSDSNEDLKAEELYEEIFSRLFSPLFVMRYG